MDKKFLINIIINVIFLVLIVLFVNYKLENFRQLSIPNTGTSASEQLQKNDSKNNTSVDVSAQNNDELRQDSVSGTIKKINNNQITIELAKSPHAIVKEASSDFVFNINDVSKIFKAEIKDQKTFADENKEYQNKLKEINDQIAKSSNQTIQKIVPPLPYTTGAGNASDLKVGSNVMAVFIQNLDTEKSEPIASEITIFASLPVAK